MAAMDSDSAFGEDSLANGINSTAIGERANATAEGASAIGQGSAAAAVSATAVGEDSEALGIGSTAVGEGADAGFAFTLTPDPADPTGVAMIRTITGTFEDATAIGEDSRA